MGNTLFAFYCTIERLVRISHSVFRVIHLSVLQEMIYSKAHAENNIKAVRVMVMWNDKNEIVTEIISLIL